MGHLPKLIQDLALILITGAITTLLFRRIKQPLVLGYIIAGFLVGPHIHITPTVADTDNINVLKSALYFYCSVLVLSLVLKN
jgi:CPA2 family monovalent cation:H+ antiporter-2